MGITGCIAYYSFLGLSTKFTMCGIFAYLNHLTPKTRKEILDLRIKGLQRLEYRGHDSAGVGIDGYNGNASIELIKSTGKVQLLQDKILARAEELNFNGIQTQHVGIAHTRWATHGAPGDMNCHPHRSGEDNKFVVVHNGIITNYKDIKQFLMTKGFTFESETDTECIAKLIQHIRSQHVNYSFRQLVEQTMSQLEGAFACVFKSTLYPGECVATRRGSPLLVGIKAEGLESDSIPVQYSQEDHPKTYAHIPADLDPTSSPLIPRKKTSAMFRVDSDHTEEIHPSD